MPLITSAMPHFCWQIKVVPDQRPLTLGVITHLSRGFKAQHLLLVSQQVYLFRAIDLACDQLPGQTLWENLMTLSYTRIFFFSPSLVHWHKWAAVLMAQWLAMNSRHGLRILWISQTISYLTISLTFVLVHTLFTHKHFVWFRVINTECAIPHRCDNLIM